MRLHCMGSESEVCSSQAGAASGFPSICRLCRVPSLPIDSFASSFLPIVQHLVLASVGGACRLFLAAGTHTSVLGREHMAAALARAPCRGLITVSNHVGSIDDPLITSARALLVPVALLCVLCWSRPSGAPLGCRVVLGSSACCSMPRVPYWCWSHMRASMHLGGPFIG